MTSGLEASLRLSADIIQNKTLLFIFCNAFCTGYPQFQLTVEPTQYINKDLKYIHCLTLYKFRLRDRIREYGICQGSSNSEESCICLEFSVCFACCPVPTRRGESGTNYWGPVIRKGARGLAVLRMFMSVLVLSLFVGCTN